MITRPALTLSLSTLIAAPAVAQTLIWADEFDTLDTAVWQPMIGDGSAYGNPGWGNNEWQFYTDRPENVRIENGELVIEARREQMENKPFTSARLRTQGKADFGYARFEARIKLPATKGVWPAFWMLPTDSPYGGWPMGGEIDIIETINNADEAYGTLHFGSPWPNNRMFGRTTKELPSYADDYHVFRVDRYPDRMEWSIDGKLYSRVFASQWYSEGAPGKPLAPFDHPKFHFLLNVAVGGNFPGNPDDTSQFPQQMRVDWVRVYDLGDPQKPYKGAAHAVPGVIEAEMFDLGGNGAAYYDVDPANTQGHFRPDESVDIAKSGEGFAVVDIKRGEWLEYTFEVTEATRVDVSMLGRSASGCRVRFDVNAASLGDPAEVKAGDVSWTVIAKAVEFPVGTHVLRVLTMGDANQDLSIDTIRFSRATAP